MLLSLALTVGCSRDLSRSKAAEILQNNLGKEQLSLFVRVGTFGEAGSPCWEVEQGRIYGKATRTPALLKYMASSQKNQKPRAVEATPLLTGVGFLSVSSVQNWWWEAGGGRKNGKWQNWSIAYRSGHSLSECKP